MAHITHRATITLNEGQTKGVGPQHRPVFGKSLPDVLFRLQLAVDSGDMPATTYTVVDVTDQRQPKPVCTLEVRRHIAR